MQFTNDIDAVFDNAQPYITNVKSEYMYMGSDDTHDFFKHMDTRKYERAPKKEEHHDCWDYPSFYEHYEDDHRFHGYECSICGELLQTG